jgi:hypothetical protein
MMITNKVELFNEVARLVCQSCNQSTPHAHVNDLDINLGSISVPDWRISHEYECSSCGEVRGFGLSEKKGK